MNRKRDFWKQLGISAGTSIAALLICYLVSLSQDGYLAKYLGLYLPEQLRAGLYDGLLYWLTLWLTFSAALIFRQWRDKKLLRTEAYRAEPTLEK